MFENAKLIFGKKRLIKVTCDFAKLITFKDLIKKQQE